MKLSTDPAESFLGFARSIVLSSGVFGVRRPSE
jgi:hypothetical protein